MLARANEMTRCNPKMSDDNRNALFRSSYNHVKDFQEAALELSSKANETY
jgi:hypothetical protein